MNKGYLYILFLLLVLASCSNEITGDGNRNDADPQLLKGIRARVSNGTETSSRVSNVVPLLIDSIGRTSFGANDEMTFTTIKRTLQSIEDFTYHNIGYTFTVPESDGDNTSGQASGYWKENNASKDIYWSDALSPHTFIGYSLPHSTTKKATDDGYDWSLNQNGYYYGSIGKVDDAAEVIDYNAGDDVRYTSENLRKEDLLLAYDTELIADESVAEVLFFHALASMRVAVTISGFSTTGSDDDSKAKVTNVIVQQQPVMYRWGQTSHSVEALTEEADASVVPSWNMKKNMKLWQPNPAGEGSGSGRRFNFYGITVPGNQNNIEIRFQVTYPNPMKPVETMTKDYTAILNNARFEAGMCTSITINLSHRDEHITIGAEYFPWHPIDSPDDGNLFKKSTFLSSAGYATVTYSGENPTKDDATWLYHEAVAGNDVVKDIYGNDGSSEYPYTITCAQEFLSFAKEVINGNNFTGRYIKLDANLYLQPDASAQNVEWPGIGDATHAFNGQFIGGMRSIKRLKGKPLFINVGSQARIENLLLEDVLGITQGGGALVETNKGIVCACSVSSEPFKSFNIKGKEETISYNSSNVSSSVAGALIGHNEGIVYVCHSQGEFTTDAARIGGLVGYNTGAIAVSYSTTKTTTTCKSEDHPELLYRGIVGYNNYVPTSLPDGKTTDEYGRLTYCFFDKTIAANVSEGTTLEEVHGMTTNAMKKSDFIGEAYRYTLLSADQKAIVTKYLGGTTLTTDEETFINNLKETLNGNIVLWSQDPSLLPKHIKDVYTDAQKEALKNHFLTHYYEHQVAEYPKIY